MSDRLFVGVLANQNSGKSRTWNDLFNLGHLVRTGSNKRRLELNSGECVEVFLVSGSFEERGLYAGDVLDNQDAKIVLCSIQYNKNVHRTLEYIQDKKFDMFVQWLNPGFHDTDVYFDKLGLSDQLVFQGATLSRRNATGSTKTRVQEIREFIYGWAAYRGLIFPCSKSADSSADAP